MIWSQQNETFRASSECLQWKQWMSIHHYLKFSACIDNLAHHVLHELEQNTRYPHVPTPNGRGSMTRPPTHPVGLKVEAPVASAEINADLICPMRNLAFYQEHTNTTKKDTSSLKGWANVQSPDKKPKSNPMNIVTLKDHEVYTDGSMTDERVVAAAVINRRFQNSETTCVSPVRLTAPSLLLRLQASLLHPTIISGVSATRCSDLLRFIVLGAVSIRKTVLPGMGISMLKIRRPNGRLIFNMEIPIRK